MSKKLILAMLVGVLASSSSFARLKRDLTKLDLKDAEQAVVLSQAALGGIFGSESGTGTPIVGNFQGGMYFTENFYIGGESIVGLNTGVTSSGTPWVFVSGLNLGFEGKIGSSNWLWNGRAFLGFAYTRKIASQDMKFGFAFGPKANIGYEVSKGIRIVADLGYIFAPDNKETQGFFTGIGIQMRRINIISYD